MSEDFDEVTGTSADTGDVDMPTEYVTTDVDSDAVDPAQAEPEDSSMRRRKKIAELSYHARELRRQNERLMEALAAREQTAQPDRAPNADDFDNLDDFVEAKIRHHEAGKANPNRGLQEQYQSAVEFARDDLMLSGSDKYTDFEQVTTSENLSITPVMRDAIFGLNESERVEVTYFLGKNPREAARISRLHPMRQIAEIGKLELQLSDQHGNSRPSYAPSPIRPVGGRYATVNGLSDGLSTDEWVKRRNAQLNR